jgi:ABC-type branched-subunit amino acid transport system ATPase component
MSLLEAEGIEAGYGSALVLHGVHLTAGPGEIVSIIGPNGAGKSTLLKALYGLIAVRAGRVLLRGTDVTRLRADLRTRRGMNFVPQTDNVFPSLTVAENLRVAVLGLARGERRAALQRVRELFPLLAERSGQRAGTLSGGQRKLVALARALATGPELLLLDEPSAGLSPAAMDLVFDELIRINALGIGILMVEQNARRALAVSHRGLVLDMGRNAHEGPGPELLHDPKVVELYLGGLPSAPAQSAPPT